MTARQRPRWPRVVWITALAALLIAAASVLTVRLAAPLPAATVSIDAPATLAVNVATAPPIPIPVSGSFALATSVDGSVASHDATIERPIGSVAKAMTGLVVIRVHPLAVGASGPSLTMTSADVALYRHALAEDGSAVPVRTGEVLTERDLLLALLLPSANNIAETLATWVSGNRVAFIAQLNAAAAAMGMDHTHFADPSGFSAQTVSSAADLVLLARAVVGDPALAELVSVRQARLPDGTIVRNLDILLGEQPGWLGVKTGWTGAAGGCLLFAARESYAPNENVTVWGAVLGQPPLAAGDQAHPELGAAFAAARSAAVAAFGAYAAVDLNRFSTVVTGGISTRWGGHTRVVVSVYGGDVKVVPAGAVLHLTVTTYRPVAPFGSGAVVGLVSGTLDSDTSIVWRVISTAAIDAPSLWWKLFSA
jgi:serine-type D-Ala-D-Ala carboxypeptidase (penicillin-binding protein 5/6)